MGLEFRRRDYRDEDRVHSLRRTLAHTHPLSVHSLSRLQSKVEDSECRRDDFSDPLRVNDGTMEASASDVQHCEDFGSQAKAPADLNSQLRARKEWNSFKKMLMHRFPVSKTSPISLASGVLVKGIEAIEKSPKDLHSGEFDDDKKFDVEDVKVINQRESLSKLQGLKDEITQSWCADDRVTSLRLSIKVLRFLMDSSVIQFYPTIFVLTTDIMDMLGDLVWNRIKQKAEFTEGGGIVRSLPENFKAGDVCFDAKETCNNWFCKIGSVRELLPRIYLELALLPCWRFLHDHHESILQRLVEMMRGIADPVASAYCRLYLVQCSQRLPRHDTDFLITCINDLKLLLMGSISTKEVVNGNLSGNSGLLLSLVQPAIEYIVRCLFKDLKQMEISKMLLALGVSRNPSISSKNYSCLSIILHCILKELPVGYICSNAVELLHLIETTDDSTFDQSLNFKLLGHRLCELVSEVSSVQPLVDKITQVLSCYESLHAYLMIVDAYLDIILENHMGMFLNEVLDGIMERAGNEKIGENGLLILQSVLLKILTHFGDIEKILSLTHFIDILDLMHGSSRNSISMQILYMATRNGQIQDPMVIEVILEVAQALYNGLDFLNMRKDDYLHPSRLVSRFVYMVDHGTDVESHLRFLAQCRGAFSCIAELQENLVHSSNNLAVRAMRDGNSSISFVKSCLAFNEVTIPAIPTNFKQLNLYIETAEVALLGGFVSHLDGLLSAAVNCLEIVDPLNAVQMGEDGDAPISLICKLCSMLVMVPGGLEQEVAYIPKRLLSFVNSQSWVLPRMKAKVLSAVVSLLAALSQNQLPYHDVSREVICNYQLFVGVQSYHQELLSLSRIVLQDIVNIVMQESSAVIRGKIALESCNCVASSFMVCDETLDACSKLVDIAKSSLSADDKFLHSTLKFLDASQFNL